jgi:hypothetical protein
MLLTILNIEQARSSNVKRDQPNPKPKLSIFSIRGLMEV